MERSRLFLGLKKLEKIMVKFQKTVILIFSITTCIASIYIGVVEDFEESVFAFSLPIGLYVIQEKKNNVAHVLSIINGIFCIFGAIFFFKLIFSITGMTSSYWQDIVIYLLGILIGILVERFGVTLNDKRLSAEKVEKQQKTQTIKGFIWPWDGSETDTIASYHNGIVYFGNTDSKFGSYDKDGNIFNQFGTKIGFVSNNNCFMDRTSEYNRLLKQFPNSEYHEECFKPNLIEPAASFWHSWLESESSITSKYIGNDVRVSKSSENDADNCRGACAAYVVATWDGLINNDNNEQHKFYFCVLDDMLKIMKAKKRR